MHLKSVELENYKCFWKSQKAEFEAGFNLFVGANNAGKTTMLEALDLNQNLNAPHRSVKNLVNYAAQPEPESEAVVTLMTDLNELRQAFGNQFHLPLPKDWAQKFPGDTDQQRAAMQRLLSHPQITLTLTARGGRDVITYESTLGLSERVFRDPHASVNCLFLNYKDWSDPVPTGQFANYGSIAPSILSVREHYLRYFYRFSALRRPAGECGNTGSPQLDREATNLPFCINHLQSNDAHAHSILCEWVSRVFPSVKWVQAPPVANSSQIQLQCLPLAPKEQRNDLSIPLSRMGTGIGNVIAMFYVVLTSRHPQVIAIDEPNSFLHPRALRELLQILSTEGKQHQFVLTAHSADVLTAVNPSLITLFEFDGASTEIKQVKGKDLSSLRIGLSELGIRMTDLHGRDRVLWVEGQTEELVMPELLRHFCPEVAAGIAVLRVEHTGTFEKKGVDPKEVASLYKRLTESSALVPPMVAILLDSEMRDPDECARLEADSKGVLRFLELTMLENYVLIPEAITAVLNELGENVSVEVVAAALALTTQDQDKPALHGAKILEDIFSRLSETRHEFKKTRDVPQIISWLLSNKPGDLNRLGQFLRNLVGLPQITQVAVGANN